MHMQLRRWAATALQEGVRRRPRGLWGSRTTPQPCWWMVSVGRRCSLQLSGHASMATAVAAGEPPPSAGRIAVAQMTAVGDQQANLGTCTRLAEVRVLACAHATTA